MELQEYNNLSVTQMVDKIDNELKEFLKENFPDKKVIMRYICPQLEPFNNQAGKVVLGCKIPDRENNLQGYYSYISKEDFNIERIKEIITDMEKIHNGDLTGYTVKEKINDR